MVQAHLGARHEKKLGHDVFGAEQFSRFAYVVGEKCSVGEVKDLMTFAFGWVDVSVKLLRKTDKRTISRRRELLALRAIMSFEDPAELR